MCDIPAVDQNNDRVAKLATFKDSFLKRGAILPGKVRQERTQRWRRLRPLLFLAPGQPSDVGKILNDHGRAPSPGTSKQLTCGGVLLNVRSRGLRALNRQSNQLQLL
jgi:hypothetical protein